MNTVHPRFQFVAPGFALTAALVAATYIGIAGSYQETEAASAAAQAPSRFYSVHNLVSDGFVPADHTDPDLVNPWGLAFNPNGVAWVADNGTGVATLYDGLGVKIGLVVTIPTPPGGTPPSAPTGNVFSGGSDFVVTSGALAGPSRFFFRPRTERSRGGPPTST